jgi:hypothetical protein
VEGWSLFDFFIVLMATLATGKLFGWRWGAVALVALALAYHEPDAPRLAWVNLLALVAILRVLPQGKLHKLLRAYWWLSVASMVLMLLPFAVVQLRQTIYPVLEPHSAPASVAAPLEFSVREQINPPPPEVQVDADAAMAANMPPPTGRVWSGVDVFGRSQGKWLAGDLEAGHADRVGTCACRVQPRPEPARPRRPRANRARPAALGLA